MCRIENREVGADKAGYAIIIYTFIDFPTNNFKFIKFHISQHIILCGNSDPLRLDLCRKLLRFVSLRADIVANMVEPAYPSLDQGGKSGFEGLASGGQGGSFEQQFTSGGKVAVGGGGAAAAVPHLQG